MRLGWPTAAALFLATALGDTLELKNGTKVQGTFLGGDSRTIRMLVDDAVKTFPVADAVVIRFGAPVTAKADPAPAPVKGAILRPEPSAPVRSAPAPAAQKPIEIPSGAVLVVRMIDDVDSERDTVGKTFRAALDEPVVVGGQNVLASGTDVMVKLVDAEKSGKLAGKTELTLDLVSLQYQGRTVEISTAEVTEASKSRAGRSAAVIGGTAAVGAVIGAIAGGGKGAAIGAASGAGAGTAVQVMTKGQRVRIPSETRLSFTLQQVVRL